MRIRGEAKIYYFYFWCWRREWGSVESLKFPCLTLGVERFSSSPPSDKGSVEGERRGEDCFKCRNVVRLWVHQICNSRVICENTERHLKVKVENVGIVRIAPAKFKIPMGASHHLAFIGNCPTISQMCPTYLIDKLLLVCLRWSAGQEMMWSKGRCVISWHTKVKYFASMRIKLTSLRGD